MVTRKLTLKSSKFLKIFFRSLLKILFERFEIFFTERFAVVIYTFLLEGYLK